MGMLQLQIPDELGLGDFELKMILASKLFEEGKLSSGQACKIVGISKRAFIEIAGKYGVSIFSTSETDLKSDIENA